MKCTKFSSVKYNDELFIVEARHGAWLSPFSENVKMKVVATSSQTCKVVIESSSRAICIVGVLLLGICGIAYNWIDAFSYGLDKVFTGCNGTCCGAC